jgi:outer membrane protein OmpA-like peptidoglycan-associated protein
MKRRYAIVGVFACLTSQSLASGGPFTLYFDPNRSDLSQPALTEIRMAADFYTSRKLTTVRVAGHADRAGTAITVIDKRTTQPLVDRAGDPLNRRVEIFIPLQ